ncbi:YraN family protein, partial [bacterium]
GGEIDIIALDGKTLVFIEVKARGKNSLGSPFEAVDFRKAAKIERAAQAYIAQKNLYDIAARFDVAAVYLGESPIRVEIIKDAFQQSSSWA